MRAQIRYIGKKSKRRIPVNKNLSGKEKYVLGEVGTQGRWFFKLSVRPPRVRGMQKLIRLANRKNPADKEFADLKNITEPSDKRHFLVYFYRHGTSSRS